MQLYPVKIKRLFENPELARFPLHKPMFITVGCGNPNLTLDFVTYINVAPNSAVTESKLDTASHNLILSIK